MTKEVLTAKRRYTPRCFFGKWCGLIARRVPFIPGIVNIKPVHIGD